MIVLGNLLHLCLSFPDNVHKLLKQYFNINISYSLSDNCYRMGCVWSSEIDFFFSFSPCLSELKNCRRNEILG